MCSEISKDNIKYYLRSPDDHEDFVFISYRKENYNDVINGIVLEMCKKYKLKIYFDYNFDKKKELWIEQAKEVISSKYCRALIAFINTAYYTSFATLFEIMATQTARANDICVIPVQLEEPNFSKFDEKDTGLGMYDKTNKNNIFQNCVQ